VLKIKKARTSYSRGAANRFDHQILMLHEVSQMNNCLLLHLLVSCFAALLRPRAYCVRRRVRCMGEICGPQFTNFTLNELQTQKLETKTHTSIQVYTIGCIR
jgi:hypothetical protein